MSGISDIVNVTITRETVVPVGLAFGWVNFVSAQATFTPIIKQYGSIEEVDADAQAGADTKAFAAKYFGQSIRPTRLYVTKKVAEDTYVEVLDDARIVNDEWYGVAIASVTAADVLAVAAWVESKTKFFMNRTAGTDVIDGADTDDVASTLQDNSYLRTATFYHHQAASVYAEAGIMGLQLPKKPGASQWAYKTIAGIPASPLTDGQRSAAFAKNVNVYTDRSNVNVFEQGRTASGEWIDTIIGSDWVTSRVQNRVFTQLVNNEKIPYTDDGVNVIVNAVSAVLGEAVTAGILAAFPEPEVTAPLVENIDSNTKGSRLLPDVKFRATLAGAIIKTEIVGRIEL